MKILRASIVTFLCFTGLITSSVAMAQDENQSAEAIQDSKLKLGINAVYTDKAFASASGLQLLPSVFYEGKRLYARGDNVGYHLNKTATDEYSLYAQYAGETFNPEKALDTLTEFDEKKATVMVGVSYLKITNYGGFQAKMAKDVVGDSEGSLATLAYLTKFGSDGLKKLRLYPSVGLQWQDKKYNNHYYGVTDQEASKSGFNSYSTGDSLHPYTSVTGMYDVTKKIGIFFNHSSHFYQDTQKNSPKIDGDITFSTAAGLTYSF